MLRPLQPNFKIRVFSKGKRPTGQETFSAKGTERRNLQGNYDYIDVEMFVSFGVTYTEQESLVNSLNFTIDKEASVLLHRFYIGQWIVFYGGYYDSSGAGMKKVFSGTVTRIRTQLPDNGKITFSVEALSYGFNQLAKTKRNFVYPDLAGEKVRGFVKGKTTIQLEDIVKGIVEEAGMTLGELKLPDKLDNKTQKTLFEQNYFRYQKMQTDWAFLNKLANDYGCSLWTETIEGEEFIYFVEKEEAKSRVSTDIGFLYPLQGEVSIWDDKAIKRKANKDAAQHEGGFVIKDVSVTDIKDNEMIKTPDSIWNRPRLIRNATITEDVADAYAVSRSAMFYDKNTGEYKNVVSEIREEDGRKVIYMYELDEAKVKKIDETHPEIADQIRSNSPLNFAWSSGGPIENEQPLYARYYYKEIAIYNEDQAVFDRAFFGITVEATCNMDLNIRAHRSYPIRGIVRYDSNDVVGNYYLMEVRHIWDSEGNITELKFMK